MLEFKINEETVRKSFAVVFKTPKENQLDDDPEGEETGL